MSTIASLSLMTGLVILSSAKNVENKQVLEELRQNIHAAVFAHRYRDTDASIRAVSMQELGFWCLKYPAVYLESNYLRYLGWMLYDSNHTVRLNTLQAMNKLFKPQLANGLRSFSERFKDRVLQMSMHEVDLHCRHEAIRVIVSMNKLGFLEDSDGDSVSGIVMCMDLKSRELIAPLIVEKINEGIESMVSRVENSGTEGSEDAIGFKSLVCFLISVSETVDGVKKAQDKEDMISAYDAFGEQRNFYLLANGLVIREQDLPDSEVLVRNLKAWFGKDDQFKPTSNFGFENIYRTVSAIAPHMEMLKVQAIN